MLKVEIDIDQLQSVINSAVDQAIERHSFSKSLPPILTRSQMMELLDIGSTKAAELLNREDFPVLKALGHPRVVTSLLLEWCETHTDWVRKNAGEGWRHKRRGA